MLLFFTLKLTKNDNCKHYEEIEYDRKRLFISESTVNILCKPIEL